MSIFHCVIVDWLSTDNNLKLHVYNLFSKKFPLMVSINLVIPITSSVEQLQNV